MNSRNIDDLDPRVAALCRKHLAACDAADIDILVTSTYRSRDSQDALYAQGRTAPGAKVTNAKGGQSFHNYRLAYDVVPLRNGKPVWGTSKPEDAALWKKVGELGVAAGLEWAGHWKTLKEFPHFQWTGGLKIADLQAGRRP